MPIQQVEDNKPKLPRWERILALPDNTILVNTQTGKQYTRGQFLPLYASESSSKVDMFKIKGTDDEEVYVPFLRKLEDARAPKMRCSI